MRDNPPLDHPSLLASPLLFNDQINDHQEAATTADARNDDKDHQHPRGDRVCLVDCVDYRCSNAVAVIKAALWNIARQLTDAITPLKGRASILGAAVEAIIVASNCVTVGVADAVVLQRQALWIADARSDRGNREEQFTPRQPKAVACTEA